MPPLKEAVFRLYFNRVLIEADMEERRFKVRKGLIVTPETEKGRSFYLVINPVSVTTTHLGAKTHTIRMISLVYIIATSLALITVLSSFSDIGLGLRRIKDALPLKSILEPKLELVKLALPNSELTQAEQSFKDSQEELNKLADRLSESRVKESLELSYPQIKELQDILRDYASRKSSEIESKTGFSKLAFPGLLHLWIEKGPFYKGEDTIVYGAHYSKYDFVPFRDVAEKKLKEAKSKNMHFLIIEEYGSLSLEFLRELFTYLNIPVSLEEALTVPEYLEILKRIHEGEKKKTLEENKAFQKGEIPARYQGGSEFHRELGEFFAENRLEVIIEDLDFEDWRRAMLFFLYSERAWQFLKQADIEKYIYWMKESVVQLARSAAHRDKRFLQQLEGLSRPNLMVVSRRGVMHLVEEGEKRGFKITNNFAAGKSFLPPHEIVRSIIEGKSLPASKERELFLKHIPANILFPYAQQHIKRDTLFIFDMLRHIVDRWDELTILKLVDAYSNSETEAINFILEWLKKSGTQEEKKLFGF